MAETVVVITPIGQYGPGVWSWKFQQGIYGFIVRDLPADEDKAKRTSLIVASGVDFARKAAA
ncbi:hypothetical protein WH240_07765 [Gluconobacter wancherniae]